MDIVISFFRDTISGIWYALYILLCILIIFVILGVVGDRKRAIISEKLKEKRRRDIESGKASQIAARESKQILDVMSDEELKGENNSAPSEGSNSPLSTENLAKKDEAPSVLVLGSDSSSSTSANVTEQNSVTGSTN